MTPATLGRPWRHPIIRSVVNLDDKSFCLFAVVLAATVCLLALFISHEDGRGGGKEMSTIAAHLANGLGFLSPYVDAALQMETTVCAPLYVWLMTAVYKLLGVETYPARLTLQLLNIVFHCATLAILYQFCRNVISGTVARWFALLFCIHPQLIYLPFNVWETSLTTLLLSLTLYIVTFKLTHLKGPGLAGFGTLLGITSLSNPAWTIAYPFLCMVPFVIKDRRKSIKTALRPITFIAISFTIVITPWLIRNYQISDSFIFIRGMAAPEFYKGNNPDANGGHGPGFVKYYLLASGTERQKLAELGENAYNNEKMIATLDYIKANPERYLQLTLQRIAMWWSGDIDALNWYIKRSQLNISETRAIRHYFILAAIMILSGLLTSLFGVFGLWLLRSKIEKLWCVLIYIFILPLPFLLMIIGFRYQSALMPFLLLPAAQGVQFSFIHIRHWLPAAGPPAPHPQ